MRRRDPVHNVTSARLSHTEDINLRQRRYIATQSLRIMCVVLATTLPVPPIWRGALLLGAVALPWFGVVMANAGPTVPRKKKSSRVALETTPTTQKLLPGKTIDGETIDGEATETQARTETP